MLEHVLGCLQASMLQVCFKHASSMLVVSSRLFSSVNTYLIQILEHKGQHIKHLLPGLHLESYINIVLQPTSSMLWHASSMSLACFKHATENHFIIISQKHYGKKQKKALNVLFTKHLLLELLLHIRFSTKIATCL